MSELLDRVRAEVRARRDELRPHVAEYERLEAASAALGGLASAPRSAPPRTAKTARKRAPRGANRTAILAAVHERPGASAGELAVAAGIKRPVAYQLLAKLAGQGELVRKPLPGGASGYSLPPEPGSSFGTGSVTKSAGDADGSARSDEAARPEPAPTSTSS